MGGGVGCGVWVVRRGYERNRNIMYNSLDRGIFISLYYYQSQLSWLECYWAAWRLLPTS